MADIPLRSSAYRWHSMEFERPDLPNVNAWSNKLIERRGYREKGMIPLN